MGAVRFFQKTSVKDPSFSAYISTFIFLPIRDLLLDHGVAPFLGSYAFAVDLLRLFLGKAFCRYTNCMNVVYM